MSSVPFSGSLPHILQPASFGVEALVLYYKQEPFHFCVYDWALPGSDRWAFFLPFDQLKMYVMNHGPGSRTNQTVWVTNKTYQVTSTGWRNDVLLFCEFAGTSDLIYRYDYPSTSFDQHNFYANHQRMRWGPIVETFQDDYQNTNELGFFGTSLMERHVEIGDWDPGAWPDMTADQSTVLGPACGFELVELDKNYTFLVRGHVT
jgi:hypothetical protein